VTNHFRRQSRRRRKLTLLTQAGLVLGVLALLAGCGGSSSGPGQGNAQASAKLTEPKTKPKQIVVRTWGDPWSTGLQAWAGRQFTADTGIKVKFDLSDFGEVQTKIQQALSSGRRPPVDVVHTVDRMADKAMAARLSVPLDVESVVTNWRDLSVAGKPRDSTNYVNIYSYTFPMIFRKGAVRPGKDISWMDLLKPQYENTFVMANTYEVAVPPIAKALGIDLARDDLKPVWDTVKKLRRASCGAGQDVEFIEFLKQKQCAWGAFIVGNAFALRDAGVPADWVVPKEGATLASDSMYVPRGLPDDVTYWAEKYVNYVIDAENQTKLTAKTGTVPTNTKARPRRDLVGDAAFPFTDAEIQRYAIPLDARLAARHDDEWQSQYAAALQG
jgi:putative spermidine/putrescine transport system substrate-binding protein